MSKPVYADGKVHVMADKCSTCIFRPGNLMGLNAGRVKGMVDESVADGGCIPCHKTTFGQRDQEAICRGFFDAHADRVQALEVAKRLGMIEEVDPC